MAGDEGLSATVYGIGVGPGDPELITLKAVRLLRAAPVIAYPAPPSGPSLARRIASVHLPGGQEEIAIRMPLDEKLFPSRDVYAAAAADIGAHLADGRDVAVLCEGDPFVYGSFIYLYARLADDWPVEVVPGVSSLTACAAVAGVPLAARNDVLSVIPATLDETALAARLADTDAAAIIKVGRHFAKVKTVLDRLGLTSRAHYVAHATMDDQLVLPVDLVAPDTVPHFSMVLVHRRGAAWR